MKGECSPAMKILEAAWKGVPHKSWRIINEAMFIALKTAVECHAEFDPDDFGTIYERFNAAYWIGCDGMEHLYRLACDGRHGPSPSAIKAIEQHLGRKAFIVATDPSDRKRIRLYVGARFIWHEGLKKSAGLVEVTSFQPAEGYDPACVVACTYKEDERADKGYAPRKIDRRFKITHADIAAYHRAIRDFKKSEQAANQNEGAA